MNVSTQTSIDKAIQVTPIDFNRINNKTQITYKYNKVVSNYHKKLNERGHSIFQWGKEGNVHKNVARNALSSFIKMGMPPPKWLNRRATQNKKYHNKN